MVMFLTSAMAAGSSGAMEPGVEGPWPWRAAACAMRSLRSRPATCSLIAASAA